MQSLENHHPDKKNKPKETSPILHKAHQKIHGIEVKDTPLFRKFHQYATVTKISVIIQNWRYGYHKEYETEPPNINIDEVKKLKTQILKELSAMIKDDLPQIKHIKGVGIVSLSGILAYAHPSRFPSLRKFLFYCGFTEASKRLRKPTGALRYNPLIKPIMFNAVECMIRAKDHTYYQLYLKFKEDMKLKYPTYKSTHYVAINRTATFLLKELYSIYGSGQK